MSALSTTSSGFRFPHDALRGVSPDTSVTPVSPRSTASVEDDTSTNSHKINLPAAATPAFLSDIINRPYFGEVAPFLVHVAPRHSPVPSSNRTYELYPRTWTDGTPLPQDIRRQVPILFAAAEANRLRHQAIWLHMFDDEDLSNKITIQLHPHFRLEAFLDAFCDIFRYLDRDTVWMESEEANVRIDALETPEMLEMAHNYSIRVHRH